MIRDPVIAAIYREYMRTPVEISSDDCKETTLTDAATNANLYLAGYLLSQGADIHARGDEALVSLCKHGYLQMLIRISTMNEAQHYKIDRIEKLALSMNARMIRYLISKGASVHAQDGNALIASSYSQSIEAFELLADLYGDVSPLLPYLSPEARKHLSMFTPYEDNCLLRLISRYY